VPIIFTKSRSEAVKPSDDDVKRSYLSSFLANYDNLLWNKLSITKEEINEILGRLASSPSSPKENLRELDFKRGIMLENWINGLSS